MATRKATSRVKVSFEQEGTGWRASAGSAEAWGRSLSEARRKIRKALGAAGKKAELAEDVVLPGNAQKELARYASARARAQAEIAALRQATRAVVSTLTQKHGISLRDASSLLGLSRERIRQLTG
ncbi:MAG TPA: hypothetical protein VHE30_07545 [Polyangiaceae bacterium]|nr:hypothetical protein [Polyangiaceae bacterium]